MTRFLKRSHHAPTSMSLAAAALALRNGRPDRARWIATGRAVIGDSIPLKDD